MQATRRTQLLTRVWPRLFGRCISVSRTVCSASSLFYTSDDSASSAESCSEADDREEAGAFPQVHQIQVLRAYLRHRRSRCLGRVREQGLVPAVLVDCEKERLPTGASSDVFISLDAKPLVAILKLIGKRDFVSRVFDMDIYRSPSSSELKESLQVLPRNLNYGPGKTNIFNIQFVRAPAGRDLKLGVPLEFLGTDRCPGLKKGGTFKMLAKYVLYKCKATEVPSKIVVDMSVLEIGDRVRVQDLEVDFDRLVSDRTTVVCEIVKDVRTLKAKARRLKNELLYKKRALATESRAQTCSLSDDEVDVRNDGEDEVVPYRYQKQNAFAQKGTSCKKASTEKAFAEEDEDASRCTRAHLKCARTQSRTSRVVSTSAKSRIPSKRRLIGTSSVSCGENMNYLAKGQNVLSGTKMPKASKGADVNDDRTLPVSARKKQGPSKKNALGQSLGHEEKLRVESEDEDGLVPPQHLGLTSSDSELDNEALPSYARKRTRRIKSGKREMRL